MKETTLLLYKIITDFLKNSSFHLFGIGIDTKMIPGCDNINFCKIKRLFQLVDNLTNLGVSPCKIKDFCSLIMVNAKC